MANATVLDGHSAAGTAGDFMRCKQHSLHRARRVARVNWRRYVVFPADGAATMRGMDDGVAIRRRGGA